MLEGYRLQGRIAELSLCLPQTEQLKDSSHLLLANVPSVLEFFDETKYRLLSVVEFLYLHSAIKSNLHGSPDKGTLT